VLVTADDPVIRGLISKVLGELGYTVLETAGGKEAVALIARDGEPIDLLITDYLLPGMTGRDLAERFAELRPEAKTLFLLGQGEEAFTDQGQPDNPGVCIQKPFKPGVLARRIREILNK